MANDAEIRSTIAPLFQYATPQNPSVVLYSDGERITRLYQNCVCCNAHRELNLNALTGESPEENRPFCTDCYERAHEIFQVGQKSPSGDRFTLIWYSFFSPRES